MRRIAIIPARGGSKRIHKKNIKDFCGKPIIAYVLEAVKDSNLFDVIHVSTDSEEIKNIVEELGFRVDFMRDYNLCDDYTPIMPVLKWVLERYKDKGVNFDEVATIMPCAPFIEPHDLINASITLKNSNYKNSVLSVSTYQAPVEWAFRLEEGNVLVPVQKEMLEKRSQDLEKCFFDTGSFAFFSNNYVLNSTGAGIDNSYIGCVIDRHKAIDIDNLDDWRFAEIVFNGLKKVSLLD
jgi:pseudaminic acid cytidylyltransferase